MSTYKTIVKKTQTKVDQYKVLIAILCLLEKIKLSDVDITALAYFVHYGMNEKTDAFLIESKVVKHVGLLRNIKTKLLKQGFLTRQDMYKTYDLNISDEIFKKLPDDFTLCVKIDNR